MSDFSAKNLVGILLLFVSFCVHAQNWPMWRGPSGDGISLETNLPVRWDSVTNVAWKSLVPGVGHSSPIVWEDKLFTLSANPETLERFLLCYAATDGRQLWNKTVLTADLEGKHRDNSYASGTPATDGKLVFVALLKDKDIVVAAFDFDGNEVWRQIPGTFYSPHGFSCSPVLHNNLLIINGNSKEGGFLAALDKSTGKLVWNVPHPESAHSFSTPVMYDIGGKVQMIFGGNKTIASYNPENGEQYWFVEGPSEDYCSSPVYSKHTGLVYMSSAWPQRIIMAINPEGNGNVTQTHVVWQQKEGAMYVPSPICVDDYIYTTMTNGKVHCIDAATGKIHWIETLGKQYSSPVAAGGLVYMPNDEGVVTVIKPGETYNEVAKNEIGERMNASPAISNGKIYLRGEKHLFCIQSNK